MGLFRARCRSSSSSLRVKWVGTTGGAWAGSMLLTTSVPNRSVESSQRRHSNGSRAASQDWMSTVSLLLRCGSV